MRRLLTALLGTILLASPAWASRQVISMGMDNAISATVTHYQSPFSLQVSAGTGGPGTFDAEALTSAGGTLSNLSVSLTVAPGAAASGKSFAITLLVDGSASALSCTVSETATTCTDTDTVSVAADQIVLMEFVPANTPDVSRPRYSLTFDSTTAKESMYGGNSDSTNISSTAAQRHFPPMGNDGGGDTVEADVEQIMPLAGTALRLYVRMETAPGAAASGDSYTFTIEKDGTATDLACVVLETATSCNDTGTTTFTAGQRLTLSTTPNSAPAASEFIFGLTLLADTDGQFVAGAFVMDSGDPPTAAATEYGHLQAGDATSGFDTAALKNDLGQAMTIKALYLRSDAAPTALNTIVWSLYNNGATSALTLTQTDAETSDSATTDVTITDGVLLATEAVASAGQLATFDFRVSYLGFVAPASAARRIIFIN